MSSPDSDDAGLSPDEIRGILGQFSKADLVRLKRIAIRYSDGTSMDADDLASEAITKVIAGERVWPRDMAAIPFLANAMRSLAWATRQRDENDPLEASEDIHAPSAAAADVSDPAGSAEQILTRSRNLKEIQQQLLDLFDDDEEAELILIGIFDDCSADEIRSIANMDETTYNSARRRMRRKINKAFPEGWQS